MTAQPSILIGSEGVKATLHEDAVALDDGSEVVWLTLEEARDLANFVKAHEDK